MGSDDSVGLLMLLLSGSKFSWLMGSNEGWLILLVFCCCGCLEVNLVG